MKMCWLNDRYHQHAPHHNASFMRRTRFNFSSTRVSIRALSFCPFERVESSNVHDTV
jgi:hypothetical protein